MKMIEELIYRLYTFSVSITISVICFLGINKYTNHPVYIHPEFRGLISSFAADAKRFNVPLDLSNLTVVFSPIGRSDNGVVGFCLPDYKTIVIYPDYWKVLSPSIKKALIYHEGAHCLLHRNHTEDKITSVFSCPVSIMYPTIDAVEPCYNELESFYIEELFLNPYKYKTF